MDLFQCAPLLARHSRLGLEVSVSGPRPRRPAYKSMILRSSPGETRYCLPSQSKEHDFALMRGTVIPPFLERAKSRGYE